MWKLPCRPPRSPDTLVDFHTDDDGSPSAAGSSNNMEADASPNSSLNSSLAHTTQWTGCDGVERIVQMGYTTRWGLGKHS